MVSSERTGTKNLTIPHADTWVRLELLKINNVRLHYGVDFHQWRGYLRYPLKFETAAVCEETEQKKILSISTEFAPCNVLEICCLFLCWGRCCCCLALLVLFSVDGNLFFCLQFLSLFACILSLWLLFLFVVVFLRLYANSQLTRCSL